MRSFDGGEDVGGGVGTDDDGNDCTVQKRILFKFNFNTTIGMIINYKCFQHLSIFVYGRMMMMKAMAEMRSLL